MSRCAPGCNCGRHSAEKKHDKTLVCGWCGRTFQAHRSNTRFCSDSCRSRAAYDRNENTARGRRWRAGKPKAVLDAMRESHRQAWRENRQAQIQGFWDAQDGRCYLCGDPLRADIQRDVHLDHDHRCCSKGRAGCPVCQRGLACKACNLLIGYGLDDPDRLRRVADSLEAAKTAVEQRLAGGALAQAPLFTPTPLR